ncbi:4,4'-diaponeurosporenoate glycosyltransferase [Aquisphaera giovannonii]|uniref:4,4'-diaponeurosporenoate glycosyltransferase n=1 Tax=Aquisphaera giovannonii TaxID=406548 RepID=A0A5B9WBP9_9BACT|nr:glycosyltransferase family 2 protein [Aquisphaera giovannonii]QEH38108.1 4,4'-diaponeurosporenoate glycosyltransferase [Aquisphaera giovannonii]
MLPLIVTSLILAALPARLFRSNLRAYRPAPRPAGTPDRAPDSCSILIPARNEESGIAEAVSAALASRGVEVEVLVGDDHSEDRTAEVVRAMTQDDPRVRLVAVPKLPDGWNGKQHACWTLANEAKCPLLLFVDADVRLAPDAVARMAAFLAESGADLASGIPRQETVGLMERLLIPLIHFVLLGFLPIGRMRRSRNPSFGAGCGQLFLARDGAYRTSGGHSAVRSTLHDGLKLPRAFRAAGFSTDLFDATDLAACRMYRAPSQVWSGLAKNAREALAAPSMIVPMSTILLGGQVLPVGLLAMACLGWPRPWGRAEVLLAAAAAACAYYPRLAGVARFRQPLLGAMLHPLGVLLLVAIQWHAFLRGLLGRPATWKGRPAPECRGADSSAFAPGQAAAAINRSHP